MNASALLTLALSLPAAMTPPGYEPEAEQDRDARVVTIVDAVVGVSRTAEEAAGVMAHMYGESRFDRFVHAGVGHPVWHEDHGRAACLSQLWPNAMVPARAELVGTGLEATKRCALATVRVLRSAAYLCTHGSMLTSSDMERVFAMMGSGHSCAPTVVSRRKAADWKRMRAALYRP